MERKHLWVCERCLYAIMSKEGNQAALSHYVDEDDDEEKRNEAERVRSEQYYLW